MNLERTSWCLALALLQASCGGGSGAAGPAHGDDDTVAAADDDSAGDDDGAGSAADDAGPGAAAADDDSMGDDDGLPPNDDDIGLLGDDDVLAPGDVVTSTDCERQVEFASVTLGEPPPFDVVIVADHSGSIAWSEGELTQGLSDLLDQARGSDVRVYVLTPTQYGASSAEAFSFTTGEDLVFWRDPVTGNAFSHAMTNYRQTCTNPDGTRIPCPSYPPSISEFSVHGDWSFQLPDPAAVITRDMTRAQLAEQQAAVTDAVLSLGTDGSPREQPACTLNRYVQQPPELLPNNVIFIVLSDEDDTSDPNDCLVGRTEERKAIDGTSYSSGCTSNCDNYRFTMQKPSNERKLTFNCVPTDDMGNTFPDQATAEELGLPSSASCDEAVTTCNKGDLAGAGFVCSEGTVIEDCQKWCSEDPSIMATCRLNYPDDSVDLCTTPFVQNDVEYADLTDYCEQVFGGEGWSGCTREGLYASAGTSYTTTGGTHPLMLSTNALGMVREFQLQAKTVFGENGFVVETILFEPEFSCELQAGQSYGETLKELASTPEDVFPICESYAPALGRAQRFAEALLQTEYPLELGQYESIQSVVVTDREGVERTLATEDFNHDRTAAVLHIEPSALSPLDESLSVEVLNVCVPKAR